MHVKFCVLLLLFLFQSFWLSLSAPLDPDSSENASSNGNVITYIKHIYNTGVINKYSFCSSAVHDRAKDCSYSAVPEGYKKV